MAERFVRKWAPLAAEAEAKRAADQLYADVVAVARGDFPSYLRRARYPLHREDGNYLLTPWGHLGVAVVCCALLALIGQAAVLRLRAWRGAARKAKWSRAAEELRLVPVPSAR
jgi:hypothetical protein